MSLERFVVAQELVFGDALSELETGKKCSHWMWVIFPQLTGLGSSGTSDFYGIGSLEEAVSYLTHPLLGTRLVRCVNVINRHANKSIDQIFDFPDNLKFRSSMTLFSLASPNDPAFQCAIDVFFKGEMDKRTIDLLRLGR